MASEDIYMSTTDSIPHYRNKVATRSEVTWATNGATMMAAYRGLENWIREHSYDAVIGVQFIACAKPDGEIVYTAYGTAVAWEF
jgi:hypothetical protein